MTYALWQRLREIGEETGTPYEWDGAPGWKFSGEFKDAIHDVYPYLDRKLDKFEYSYIQTTASTQLKKKLRCLVALQRGGGNGPSTTPTTWWISAEWPKDAAKTSNPDTDLDSAPAPQAAATPEPAPPAPAPAPAPALPAVAVPATVPATIQRAAMSGKRAALQGMFAQLLDDVAGEEVQRANEDTVKGLTQVLHVLDDARAQVANLIDQLQGADGGDQS